MKIISFLLFGLLFCLIGFTQTPRINFTPDNKYPEGLAYNDKKNLFYVSSVQTGAIGTVDEKGMYKVLYQDTTLKSSYGMKVSAARDRLWVCTGDPNYSKYASPATHKKIARLISIDLATGKKVSDIDLSKLADGDHFINDMTFDDKGNIYVTDSYAPIIYKIDATGTPTIFAQNDMFKGEGLGLNGIAWHPGGFLLVGKSSDGDILKVDIKDPTKITKVKIKQFFPGADGMLLDAQNNLILIQNKGVEKIFKIASNDQWQSAEVKAATAAEDRFQQPSSGVFDKDKLYVLNSKVNELADPTKKPSTEFSLQLVQFNPVP